MLPLAPEAAHASPGSIPFLTSEEGLGERHIIAEAESQLSGYVFCLQKSTSVIWASAKAPEAAHASPFLITRGGPQRMACHSRVAVTTVRVRALASVDQVHSKLLLAQAASPS